MAGAVRQPINVQSLENYIEKNVSDIKIPIDVKQFGFGQSNPTYQLTDKYGSKYVLRKKPPGDLLSKTAHKVEREHRIIHALEDTDVPVPKTYCFCEDIDVVGTPFYIMSFLDGRIIEDASLPDVTPTERTEMWHDAIRTIAKLHRIDSKAVGLENYGKPTGFYTRQIATFQTIMESQAGAVDIETNTAVGKIPHADDILEFFKERRSQPDDRGTLIHGDYKIDNLVFHKTEPRVIGILDWEMSTVGHPLSDLANLLSPYVLASEGNTFRHQPAFHPSTTPGLPTREQCIGWYREIAGWDPQPEMTWGDAFGTFRNSVIMQGIAARYARRQASSARAKEYAEQMCPSGEFTWSLVEKLKEGRGAARL
ncbi:MAG: hypothetical protein M1812_002949 [Candelaria pacifica]|nr:MAG: hypothetical protein M1812_002949 [Candelaria pacifica]